jgi:hypothetical protein
MQFPWMLMAFERYFMDRYVFTSIFSLILLIGSGFSGISINDSESVCLNLNKQDTIKENQILFNGKAWSDFYFRVRENQFLFSKDFLTGSISINGKSFENLNIRYDIYNDEIMTPTNNGVILQLNKEMIDSFTIIFENITYNFIKIQEDSLKVLKGYVNVLYRGKSALYVKYKKEIQLLAEDGKYDLFLQTYRIYLLKGGIIHQINSKSDLLKILNKDKTRIRDFIKKNKLTVSKKMPESFIPVIRYYDSISQ